VDERGDARIGSAPAGVAVAQPPVVDVA